MKKTNFNDTHSCQGWLEIFKLYKNGTSELVHSDKNIVVNGMGFTVASLFSAEKTDDLEDYQILRFCLGTGAASVAVTTENLASPLSTANYGDSSNFTKVTADVGDNAGGSAVAVDQTFGAIPSQYVNKVDDRRMQWQLVVDEETANVSGLTEIGIYSVNPKKAATENSVLCAYKTFSAIDKTSSFILVFRWTIEF